jgi:hypothetical protein
MQPPPVKRSAKEWDDAEKAEIAAQVLECTLSIRDACARYGLEPECIREWVVRFRRSSLQAFDEHLRRTLASQGLDASGLAGAEFTGTLVDISVADLIQTMGFARKDGVISVSHAGADSRIWCAAGEVVDAESGKLRGEAAVYRILSLQQGIVVAEFCPVARAPALRSSTAALLLEGARRLDECSVLRQRLGTGAYAVETTALAVGAAYSPREFDILRLFESPRSVLHALSESELGDLETLTTISKLVHDARLVPGEEWSRTTEHASATSRSTASSLMDFMPSAARRRARRHRRAAQLFGLAAACLGGWVWVQAALGSRYAPVRERKVPEVVAPLAASGSASAAPVEIAPAAFPIPAERVEESAPTTTISLPFVRANDSLAELPSPSPAPPAAATSAAPLVAVRRTLRPRTTALPAQQTDGAGGPRRSPTPAVSSIAPAVPRMQLIEDQAPQMQTLE